MDAGIGISVRLRVENTLCGFWVSTGRDWAMPSCVLFACCGLIGGSCATCTTTTPTLKRWLLLSGELQPAGAHRDTNAHSYVCYV